MILQVVPHCNSCGPGGHFHWPCQEPVVFAWQGMPWRRWRCIHCWLLSISLAPTKGPAAKSDGRMILAKRKLSLELCCWMFLLNLELPLPITGWWFQTFFVLTPTRRNDPIWLIFFKGVETRWPWKNIYTYMLVRCIDTYLGPTFYLKGIGINIPWNAPPNQ